MYTTLIVITLQLFPNGVVKKNTEEFYLTKAQDCIVQMYKVVESFDKNENENLKLLSVACSEKGKA